MKDILIKTPGERKKEVLRRLKLAFDSIADSRGILKEYDLMRDEYEPLFQKIGQALLGLAKDINKNRKEEQKIEQ